MTSPPPSAALRLVLAHWLHEAAMPNCESQCDVFGRPASEHEEKAVNHSLHLPRHSHQETTQEADRPWCARCIIVAMLVCWGIVGALGWGAWKILHG
jgi:hypothetical protein